MRMHNNLGARRAVGASVISAAIAAIGLTTAASAQTEFQISTGGATALGAFTRMNNNANAPTFATFNRGPLALGAPVTIGSTSYTLQPGVTYMGIADLGTGGGGGPIAGEPTTSQDRLNYWYRESGSIQGVLDLADSNGLRASQPGVEIRPGDPAANLFLWQNGARYNSVSSGY